jgi:hypothetical protein
MEESILFYSSKKEYYEFSNFYICNVTIDNKIWSTTEHYFQAMKFNNNPNYMEKIRLASSPAEAKKLGNTRKIKLRPDWENVKEEIMMTAIREKFTQSNKLKKILLSTGNAYIAEHTKNDYYWGDGLNGSGKNRLGHLLIKLREEIIKN